MRLNALIFASLIFAQGVFADEMVAPHEPYAFPVGGRVYTDQYGYTETRKFVQSSYSVWLDLDSKTENGLGERFIGEFDVFAKSMEKQSSWSTYGQIREAYVSYLGEGYDIRLGQQIIPWGKSDGINPTDYFTAKNYTFLNPADEVKRQGAPGASLSFTPEKGTSPFTIQGVFQAYYPQTKLLIPDTVIPPKASP
jgi:hypothetical protein